MCWSLPAAPAAFLEFVKAMPIRKDVLQKSFGKLHKVLSVFVRDVGISLMGRFVTSNPELFRPFGKPAFDDSFLGGGFQRLRQVGALDFVRTAHRFKSFATP